MLNARTKSPLVPVYPGRTDDSMPACTYQSLCHVHIKGGGRLSHTDGVFLAYSEQNPAVDRCVLLQNLSVMIGQDLFTPLICE